MKIADSQSIKAGEKEMILSIIKKIDPEVLSSIATQELASDSLEFVSGDMEIDNNRIVYRVNFKVTVDMSVVFDREGNLVRSGDETVLNETAGLAAGTEQESTADDDVIDLRETAESDDIVDDSNSSEGDDIEDFLQKNKDFWLKRTEDAQ